jgi:hypothetical protein
MIKIFRCIDCGYTQNWPTLKGTADEVGELKAFVHCPKCNLPLQLIKYEDDEIIVEEVRS